jgi:glycyl-tRNA synthetase beta chain
MPEAVADAIRDHYKPLGPNDACPTDPVSVTLALAEKIDTLAGFFSIGETPTGSKDPFALRRAALGIIRLIVENKLRIRLGIVFLEAMRLSVRSITKSSIDHAELAKKAKNILSFSQAKDLRLTTDDVSEYLSIGMMNSDRFIEIRDSATQGFEKLLPFIAERLRVTLREGGIRYDLIDAIFALGGEDDLVRLLDRGTALQHFLATDDGANLLTAYRRAANILRIEEKRDNTSYDGAPDPALFSQADETALARALDAAGQAVDPLIAAEDFKGAMAKYAELRPVVDAFFDRVTVNADVADMRTNRLRLLSRIRGTLNKIADFSRIV